MSIKVCELCGISYIPDYRSKGHQKCCPYRCVELNRKNNRLAAKIRYRKTRKALFKASEYNGRYRQRKQDGDMLTSICGIDYKTEDTEKKLRDQIKYLYKKLNSHSSIGKAKQLDRVLHKISDRIRVV